MRRQCDQRSQAEAMLLPLVPAGSVEGPWEATVSLFVRGGARYLASFTGCL